MKKPLLAVIVTATLLIQSAAFADVTSYYSSPPTKTSTGSSSTGTTSSNPNIVTGNHFSNINPYGPHNTNYDINSNETTIDSTYNPTIQLNCSHDDSCIKPPIGDNR